MFGKPLEKAYIEILAGNGAGGRIKVMFNPAEYSLERGNAYKSTPLPGLGSPLIQFVNGDAATLSMDLFLDDWTDPDGPVSEAANPFGGDSKSVKQRIDEIVALLDIDEKLHAPRPVRFVWGPLRFDAVLANDRDDIRFPYVLGTLWSDKDKPPEKNQNKKNDIRVIKSRKGHLLKFDDAAAKGSITIELTAHRIHEQSRFLRASRNGDNPEHR